ncbi:pentatricopeptide repeat-containing protein [Tanacetum coccineum]
MGVMCYDTNQDVRMQVNLSKLHYRHPSGLLLRTLIWNECYDNEDELQSFRHKARQQDKVYDEREESCWILYLCTGIFYMKGHEGVMNEVPDGAAIFASSYWLRNSDMYRMYIDAMLLFGHMVNSNVRGDYCTMPMVLKACAKVSGLRDGGKVHCVVMKDGFLANSFVGTTLIDMYCSRGKVGCGFKVFGEIEFRNVVTWTSMIGGYVLVGEVGFLRKLFDLALEFDVVMWNTMVSGHIDCGELDGARKFVVIMSLHGYSDSEYDNGSNVDNVTLIGKLNVSHPLHLHPNDSVALTVVSVKLKGTENYQVWSCAMLLALKGKNKTGFIDGSCRRIIGYPADFRRGKAGSNFKGKNVSNNVVSSSSSNGFSNEQMATLISLIKENFVNGKGIHTNMAELLHPLMRMMEDVDDFASENESFAAYEDKNNNSEGNDLHDQNHNNVSQDNNGVQNLIRNNHPRKLIEYLLEEKLLVLSGFGKLSASSIDLKAYSGADWARCADTRGHTALLCIHVWIFGFLEE